jgi:hypothetical protein
LALTALRVALAAIDFFTDFLDRDGADSFAAAFAFFGADLFAVFAPSRFAGFFAARFLRTGCAATRGTSKGSETKPSAVSGM